MRWEKIRDEPAGHQVVRALSFSTRAEDGTLLSSPAVSRARTTVRPQPSFTSIDVKKSRRVARRPTALHPPTAQPVKSCTLPPNSTLTHNAIMDPLQTSTPLGGQTRPRDRASAACKTQSLGRPARVNKLVLRVPSAASEYQHRRVIHSVPTPVEDGGVEPAASPPLVSQACQTNLGGLPTIICDSSFCAKNQVPLNHNSVFAQEQGVYSITRRDGSDQWRLTAGGSSDAASASISNLSSGDGVSSTLSRLSHHMNYDGLSTSTHMGSTTRLVPNKPKAQERCGQCLCSEHVSTAFAVLTFAGTLGNLLRLPRLVYFHGGGVFLLIYVLFALLFGIPLTFLEIGMGQFCQHGAVKLWRAVNLFRGVGYAKVFLSFVLAVSYSTQVASALALLVHSLSQPSYSNCHLLNAAKENISEPMSSGCHLRSVLAGAADEPSWFGVRLLFVLLTWTLVLICLMKRSATFRKTSYFLFPAFLAVLAGLLAEVSNQPGANLSKLFVIDWAAFGKIEVWYLAAVQVFFSLQVGFGNLNTCAGRIYPKSNAVWTAISLVGSNVVMGVCCVILVYLLASMTPLPYDVINSSSSSFVLIAMYSMSSISTNAAVWLALVYILVLIAGLSSLIGLMYTVLAATAVESKRKLRWRYINGAVCLTGLLLAMLSLIPADMQVSESVEYYGVGRAVMALTVLELLALAGIYGSANLYNDLEFLIGRRLCCVWKFMWCLTPCVLVVLEISSAVLMPTIAGADVWQAALGWTIYAVCWSIVIVCAIYQVSQQVDYNLAQKIVSAVKPSRNWGPVDPIYRHCWVQWRNRYNLTGTRDFTLKRRGTRDFTHHARTGTPVKTDTLPWHISKH